MLPVPPFSTAVGALVERGVGKNLQLFHTKKLAEYFQHQPFFLSKNVRTLKAVDSSCSFLTTWEDKHVHPFLWKEKLHQREIFAGKKVFFNSVKLNDNYRSVLCACLITYFLCPKGKKEKRSVCLDSPMETFLVRWVFIGTL